MTRLRDVAEILRGVTFRPEQLTNESDPEGVICYRTKNIQTKLETTNVLYVPRSVVKNVRQFTQPGDVLISSANSANLIGKSAWVGSTDRETTFGGFISTLRARDGSVDKRYLFRWFSSPAVQNAVRSFSRQTTNIANLDISRTLDLEISLPSLAEQRRIAGLLDEADLLQSLALIQVEANSSARKAFLDSNARPTTRYKLGHLFEVKGGKRLPKGSAFAENRTAHPYLRVVDMGPEGFLLQDLKYIDDDVHQSVSRYVVATDDIVISIAGTVGRTAVIPAELAGANLTENAALLRPRGQVRFEPRFVREQINSVRVQSQIDSATGQVTIRKLGLNKIEQLNIDLPDYESQSFVVDSLRMFDDLAAQLARQVTALDELFASLQHRAFTGQL